MLPNFFHRVARALHMTTTQAITTAMSRMEQISPKIMCPSFQYTIPMKTT